MDRTISFDHSDVLAQKCVQAALDVLCRQQNAANTTATEPILNASALIGSDFFNGFARQGRPYFDMDGSAGASLTPERRSETNQTDGEGGSPVSVSPSNDSLRAWTTDALEDAKSVFAANSAHYKVRLCRDFVQRGTCNLGSQCACAHGVKEIRTTEQNMAAIHSIFILNKLHNGRLTAKGTPKAVGLKPKLRPPTMAPKSLPIMSLDPSYSPFSTGMVSFQMNLLPLGN